jgi:hypothetical protein
MTLDEIKSKAHEALQASEFTQAFERSLAEAQAKQAEVESELAMLMIAAGIESINTGEGCKFEVKESAPRIKWLPNAISYLNSFNPSVTPKYFTPAPKVTQKGLEQARKDGAITRDQYQQIFDECAEFEGDGEVTVKKVADKEFFKDASL